jgi:hypothetical protein
MPRSALLAVVSSLAVGSLLAQGSGDADRGWGWRWNRVPPRFPDPNAAYDRAYSFCRILYKSVRREPLGHGWSTDYPSSDSNFMQRLSELTRTRIRVDPEGEPDHVVVTLTDDALFDYPFIFMSDVGTAGFSEEEVVRLRQYLLRGGFLHVDDFWGNAAWDHWAREIGRVLPPQEYPIQDIPLDHPVFSVLYRVSELPQIPSIQFWRRSGGGTSERGAESAEPHFRGIWDGRGRLMVVMTHNTDIADGWEREGEDDEFFYRFSVRAYPFEINLLLYAMSH